MSVYGRKNYVIYYLNSPEMSLIVHEPDNFLLPVTESKSNNTFLSV